MGLKKSARRLLKLGQRAAKALGSEGKAWVDAVFQTASQVIEDELARKEPKPKAKKATSAAKDARATKPPAKASSKRRRPAASAAHGAPARRPAKSSAPKARAAAAAGKKDRPPRPKARVERTPSEPQAAAVGDAVDGAAVAETTTAGGGSEQAP